MWFNIKCCCCWFCCCWAGCVDDPKLKAGLLFKFWFNCPNTFELLFPNIVLVVVDVDVFPKVFIGLLLFVIVFDVVLPNKLIDGVTAVVFEPKKLFWVGAVLLFEVEPNTFVVLFPNKFGVWVGFGLEVVVPNVFTWFELDVWFPNENGALTVSCLPKLNELNKLWQLSAIFETLFPLASKWK